jgi:hypothetical protein
MVTVKAVIFANRTAFEGVETAVFNYLITNNKNIDSTVVKRWSNGIDSTDDSKVLMVVDDRVLDFPWNPHAVVDVSINDPKWFPDPNI